MSRDALVSAVLMALVALGVGIYREHLAAQSQAAEVYGSEVKCGEQIVAIVGQFKPAEE